ncbi:hypothetical protein [Haloarchaeobius sp. HRN-SO-5]|uniref:hypothetical protein n=1 Tax=Haloarchaeobius sp. HRN-SO-5 TaxID=3446118 RepID=UPI003EBD3544
MTTTTKLTTLVLVGLLATTAGCAALGAVDGASTTSPATGHESQPGNVTETASVATTSTETTVRATRTATTHSHDGPTSDHDHDGTDGTAEASGSMAVVVDGDRLDLGSAVADSTTFRMDGDHPDTWHANGTPTLAAALAHAGVNASATTLSYDGSTYRDAETGTELVYRVNGDPVRPTEYALQDGDEVWVVVLTDETNASTPGEYIPPERLHVHGSMEFEVNGDSLDFSRDKWQAASHNSHFHFEGGHADPWHAHSRSVTLAYALSTLEDVEVTEAGITYDGTTYADDDPGTTVSVTVNGDPVDPTEYYLLDGDEVRIVVEDED